MIQFTFAPPLKIFVAQNLFGYSTLGTERKEFFIGSNSNMAAGGTNKLST